MQNTIHIGTKRGPHITFCSGQLDNPQHFLHSNNDSTKNQIILNKTITTDWCFTPIFNPFEQHGLMNHVSKIHQNREQNSALGSGSCVPPKTPWCWNHITASFQQGLAILNCFIKQSVFRIVSIAHIVTAHTGMRHCHGNPCLQSQKVFYVN